MQQGWLPKLLQPYAAPLLESITYKIVKFLMTAAYRKSC